MYFLSVISFLVLFTPIKQEYSDFDKYLSHIDYLWTHLNYQLPNSRDNSLPPNWINCILLQIFDGILITIRFKTTFITNVLMMFCPVFAIAVQRNFINTSLDMPAVWTTLRAWKNLIRTYQRHTPLCTASSVGIYQTLTDVDSSLGAYPS